VGRDALADPIGDLERLGLVRIGQQHHELLAAVAGGDVRRADLLLQDPGDAPEHLIAGHVAVGVVVPLEVIHVEDDQRQGGPMP
jgi:hypothetical protein